MNINEYVKFANQKEAAIEYAFNLSKSLGLEDVLNSEAIKTLQDLEQEIKRISPIIESEHKRHKKAGLVFGESERLFSYVIFEIGRRMRALCRNEGIDHEFYRQTNHKNGFFPILNT